MSATNPLSIGTCFTRRAVPLLRARKHAPAQSHAMMMRGGVQTETECGSDENVEGYLLKQGSLLKRWSRRYGMHS